MMRLSRIRWIGLVVVLIGGALICVNIHGLIVPAYDRTRNAQEWPEAVSNIDAAWNRQANRELSRKEFLEVAASQYAEAIEYVWPKHKARVAVTDNWILWFMGYFDSVVTNLGLTNVEGLFQAYETVDYRRALARGYGICSQNALGLASLLERRYGMNADVIGLDGHVVVEAGGRLLDPSVGLVLPFALAEAEEREKRTGEISRIYENSFTPDQVTRVYDFNGELESENAVTELGKYYDASGNVRIEGAVGYRPILYWFERASDWMVWIVPGLMLLVGGWGLFGGRGSRGRHTRA